MGVEKEEEGYQNKRGRDMNSLGSQTEEEMRQMWQKRRALGNPGFWGRVFGSVILCVCFWFFGDHLVNTQKMNVDNNLCIMRYYTWRDVMNQIGPILAIAQVFWWAITSDWKD